jgi:hypothetical protein
MTKQVKRFFMALVVVLLFITTAIAADGQGLKIAVIDTGISTAAISPDSIVGGYNYLRPTAGTEDNMGHGTAVSSLIVGSVSAQVTGLCPTASLVALVYTTKDDAGTTLRGDTVTVSRAVYDAVDLYDCQIINISSGTTTDDPRLRAAVRYAVEKGVLVVASAGNSQETEPGSIYYPAAYDGVLSVGACDSDGTIASFSQQNRTVDLLASGVKLHMAGIKGTGVTGSGTSFSAAVVSGAAAQMWTNNPTMTAEQVREAILSCTTTVDGWKVLDLPAALAYRQPVSETIEGSAGSASASASSSASDALISKTYSFSDVSESDSYYDAVIWAAEQGITLGSNGKFLPTATCTRAQAMTFLWRAAGKPQATTNVSFADVSEDSYYAQAVAWAVEQGITVGTSATTFSPDASCTEGQILTFLWRAMGQPDANLSLTGTQQYYAAAVAWAESVGMLESDDFSAATASPRSHIVSYLYECIGKAA